MTKRFTYLDYNDTVRDNETGKEYHTWYEDNLLDLLNELADEKEQLKQENKRLHTEWRMQKKIIETYGKRVNR